jgi:hypothetical protein
MDSRTLRTKVQAVNGLRTAVLVEALAIGPTLTGSLFKRYRMCGKPGCRCTRGTKHGPYWCLSLFRAGTPRVFPVAPTKAVSARTAARAYRRWRTHVRRLRALDAALLGLLERLRQAAQLDPEEVIRKRP